MKTPEEWVTNLYDGYSFNLDRRIEISAREAIEFIKNIQAEAFHEGQMSGLDIGKETALKTISEVFEKPAKE